MKTLMALARVSSCEDGAGDWLLSVVAIVPAGNRLVELKVGVRHGFCGEAVPHQLVPALGEFLAQHLVIQQAQNRGGERITISGRNQQSGFFMQDDSGHGPYTGCNNSSLG